MEGNPPRRQPSPSLGRWLVPEWLLAELGVQPGPTDGGRPGNCPICHGHDLRIYPDRALGGHWYACGGCGFRGDGVDLAAQVWNLPVARAALRLSACGIRRRHYEPLCNEQQAADHEAYVARHRAAVESFWAKARTPGFALARELMARAGLAGAAAKPDWARGMGRFVGAASRAVVESLFLAEGTMARRTLRPSGVAAGPRFNRQYDEYLVLAHHDIPGRICGFTLLVRDGQFPDDVLYLPAFHPNVYRHTDHGLAFFDAAAAVAPPDRPCVYVGDPLVVIRVQAAYHAATGQAAPLALAWCADANGVTDASRVLHEPTVLAPNVLAPLAETLARQLGGRVCLDPTFSGPGCYNRFHDRALTPGVAPEPRGGGTLALHAPARERADAEARLPNLVVYERNRAWFEENGTPVSDASVVIDHVVRFPNAHHTSYRCSVYFHGERVPVTIPAAAQPEIVLDRIRRACVAAGVGRPTFSRKASRTILEIARQMREPKHLDGCEDVGYDPASGLVHFPRFSIDRDGTVRDPIPCLPFLPGGEVPPPAMVSQRDREIFLEGPEAGLILLTLAWTAATLLEASTGTPVPRLAIIGEAACAFIKATLAALGLGEQANRPWPRFVNAIPCRAPYAGAIPIWMQDVPMFSLASGWAVYDGREISSAADRHPAVLAAPALFSSFLQVLAAKGFTAPGASRPVSVALTMLRDWLSGIVGRESKAAAHALDHFLDDAPDERPARAAKILREAHKLWSPLPVERVGGRSVIAIPRSDVCALILRKRTPTPGPDAFVQMLQDANVAVGTRDGELLLCANWLHEGRLYRRRPGEPGAPRKASRKARSFSQP